MSPDEASKLDIPEYMENVVRFSRKGFLAALKADEQLKHNIPASVNELWKLAPLDIGKSSDKETVGYKAAWKRELCKVAVQERLRYEAAANLDWLGLHLAVPELRGDTPNFASLDEVRKRLFVPSDVALASSQGGMVAAEHLYNFPVTLATYTDSVADLDKDSFEHELPLLDRYPIVWSFWLQVYRTIKQLVGDEKTSNLHLLYTAFLSVTLEVRVGMTIGEAALWSTQRSETMSSSDTCLF